MNLLLKWTLISASLMVAIDYNHAWNIGSKGRDTGPAIHTSYFLTSNNQAFNVRGIAYVGFWVNGMCRYNNRYELGLENLKSGDMIDIDAFLLKSVMGGGYSCLSIYYFNNQTVIETFQLIWDGMNYINSVPPVAEVNIL